MDWNEQSQTMIKMWTDAQQQMMQSWSEMVQPSSANNLYSDSIKTWQDMMMKNIQTWTSGADPVAQGVAQQMFASQSATMKMLELAMQTWQKMVPTMNEGGDWQAALQNQMKQMQDELVKNSMGNMNAMEDMTELWQSYVNQWMGFASPWANASQASMGHLNGLMGGDRNAMMGMNRLYWDAYQETFGQLLQAPGLGYTREMDEKVRQSFAAWLELQNATTEYQSLVADIWVKAFEEVMRKMVNMTETDEQIESVRGFLTYWSETADEVFKDAFRSEAYVAAQGKLVDTMLKFRVKQRDVNEIVMEMYDIPTRTEIDEAHRRIYELRKEMKSLKKEIVELKSAPKKSSSTRKRSSSARKKSSTESDS